MEVSDQQWGVARVCGHHLCCHASLLGLLSTVNIILIFFLFLTMIFLL